MYESILLACHCHDTPENGPQHNIRHGDLIYQHTIWKISAQYINGRCGCPAKDWIGVWVEIWGVRGASGVSISHWCQYLSLVLILVTKWHNRVAKFAT